MAGNLDGSRSRGSWVHQPPRYFRDMFSVLMQQRLEQQYCDAQVIVNGQTFPAHKALLAANSNFFHQYFTINKNSSRVELNNISAESFKSIVEFMYSGRLLLQESNVTDVLQTASLLQMHDIVTVCCNFVKEKLQANRVEHNLPDNTQLQRTDSQGHVSFDPPQVTQQINQPGRSDLGIAVTEEAGPASLVGAMRRKCTVVPRRAISPSMGPDYSVDRDSGMNTSSDIGGHDSHPEDVQTDSMDVVVRVKSEDTSDDRVLAEAGAASSSSQENPALLSQSSDGSERDFVAPPNQGATNPLQVMPEQSMMDTGRHPLETSPSSASWESPLHSDSSSDVHPVAIAMPNCRQEGQVEGQAWAVVAACRLTQQQEPGAPETNVLPNSDVQCPFCYDKFSAVFELWRHVKGHRGDNPPHLCKICGTTSPTQKDLDIHIQYNHPGIKMYQCCFCPTKFCHKRNIMQNLHMHMF
ncbi:uncharacterized protein LOC144904599 isoform X2 [Branchiostoma floridae x Branchiostoma belcheri]